MKRTLSIAASLLLGGALTAQVLNTSYEHTDVGIGSFALTQKLVTELQNGNIAMAADSPGLLSTIEKDILITTTHNDGTVIWSNSYGDQGMHESVQAILESENGQELIVVGFREEIGLSRQAFVFSVEIGSGSIIWEHTYGLEDFNQTPTAITHFGHGSRDYMITGFSNQSSRVFRPFVMCIDAAGDLVWDHRYLHTAFYQEEHDQFPTQIIRNGPESFLIAGTYRGDQVSDKDVFLIEINHEEGYITNGGDMLLYHLPQNKISYDPTVVAYGSDYYMAYTSLGIVPSGTNGSYPSILKLNSAFNPQWATHYHSPNTDFDYNTIGLHINTQNQRINLLTSFTDRTLRAPMSYLSSGHFSTDLNGGATALRAPFTKFNVDFNIRGMSSIQTSTGMLLLGWGSHVNTVTIPGRGISLTRVEWTGSSNSGCDKKSPLNSYSSAPSLGFERYDHYNYNLEVNGTAVQIRSEHGRTFNCSGQNGSFKSTESSSMSNVDTEIKAYPNPVSAKGENLVVEWQNAEKLVSSLEIWNVTGQLVFAIHDLAITEDGKTTVPAANLSSGVNLVALKDEQGNILTKQTIIKH